MDIYLAKVLLILLLLMICGKAMQKIWQQVGFDADVFSWLREEQVGRKQKNLSTTINELLKNYQIMIKSVDRARESLERQEKAKQEAAEIINKYRGQIIKDEKI